MDASAKVCEGEKASLSLSMGAGGIEPTEFSVKKGIQIDTTCEVITLVTVIRKAHRSSLKPPLLTRFTSLTGALHWK